MNEYNNITLVGVPGAGKSTIGKFLAQRIGYEFIDGDEHLLVPKINTMNGFSLYKHPIENFKKKNGEKKLIELEEKILSNRTYSHNVISPGGSVVYEEDALQHFLKSGLVFLLNISYKTMINRIPDIATRGVILNGAKDLEEMYHLRMSIFDELEDHFPIMRLHVDDSSEEEVVSAILNVYSQIKQGEVCEIKREEVYI